MQKAIEIRLLCEVVVLSAIYCNPPLTLNLLEQIRFPDSPEAITEQFFSRLLEDAEHFEGYTTRTHIHTHTHTHTHTTHTHTHTHTHTQYIRTYMYTHAHSEHRYTHHAMPCVRLVYSKVNCSWAGV